MFYKFFDKKRKRFKGRKRNKILADKGSELYNSSMKSCYKKMTDMYSTHNEEIHVLARRFVRSLKNKIYKYVTAVSRMCILIG